MNGDKAGDRPEDKVDIPNSTGDSGQTDLDNALVVMFLQEIAGTTDLLDVMNQFWEVSNDALVIDGEEIAGSAQVSFG